MRLVGESPQRLLIWAIFCRRGTPLTLQIPDATRLGGALAAHAPEITQDVAVRRRKLVVGKPGM